MDREASFLRCSKLSCYTEFNKMVQKIAKMGGGLNEFQSTNGGMGTSTEYNFYYTLSAMLREIVRNTDPIEQKSDLQKVYKWYCLNKPIIPAKTRRNIAKPSLALKSTDKEAGVEMVEKNRPQTAPATLCEVKVPVIHSAFASSFMQRSLLAESNHPGQPFDELQTTKAQLQTGKTIPPRPKSIETMDRRAHSRCSRDYVRKPLAVVEFPFAKVFTDHRRPATVPTAINCEQLFNLSSEVAANMVLDKEMKAMRERFIRRTVSAQPTTHLSPRKLVSSPIDQQQTTREVQNKDDQKENDKSARGKRQETSMALSTETSSIQPAKVEKPLFVKGQSVNFSETDKLVTILEEKSPPVCLGKSFDITSSGTKVVGNVESEQIKKPSENFWNKHENKSENEEIAKQEPISSVKTAIERVSKPPDEEDIAQIPISAKVVLKSQFSKPDDELTSQKAAARKSKRLGAGVKVITLEFVQEDNILPRPRVQGHLHKRRAQAHTVHGQQPREFSRLTTMKTLQTLQK